MLLTKIKTKFSALCNRDKLIVCGIISMIIMLVVGVIFKLIGINHFLIDKNVKIEYKGNHTLLFNAILYWINFYFFLAFSLKEYTIKILPKWIFSFPIIFICSYCELFGGFITTSLLPIVMILYIQFDWTTMKRVLMLSLIMPIYQLISMFVKMNVFNIIPLNTANNLIQSFIYSIDLYIFLLFIILIDRNEVIKCRKNQ